MIFSLALIYLWNEWQVSHAPQAAATTAQNANGTPSATPEAGKPAPEMPQLLVGDRIQVKTDVLQLELNTIGGDIRQAHLLKYGSLRDVGLLDFTEPHDASKPFQLFDDGKEHLYIAQTGLVGGDLPSHNILFTTKAKQYELASGQDKLSVEFTAKTASGIEVIKRLTFSRGSYVVDVDYQIINNTTAALNPRAYFRLLRDGKDPAKESSMVSTFTGPVTYTAQDKFHKLAFSDIAKDKAEFNHKPDNGWVGMVQHYFASAWLLNQAPAQDGAIRSICKTQACELEIKRLEKGQFANNKTFDDVYSAAVLVNVGAIAPGKTGTISMPLFMGPEDARVFASAPLKDIAPELNLVKDYGWATFIASPLFWLLLQVQKVISNWGWSIVVLTIIIKAALYPLSAAGYKSMANMKKLAPKLASLKDQFGDDKMKYQQAMMEMYKTEKINPLGGCLPILIQIPVFFALYSVLSASIEMREAPFIFWIHDLSVRDPYFVLPVLMAVTMYLQTFLNPPPTDPMQAKMMKIMPIAFSVMFFVFPVGLVVYYLVNNILSMLQQWWVNKQYGA